MPDPNETAQALWGSQQLDPNVNELQNVSLPPEKLAQALLKFGQQQAQGIANLAMTPGAVAQGQQSVEQASDWGPAMAMALMGRGTLAPEAGAAGIFGGRLAKTADIPALAKAQVSQIKGATPTDIWHGTGWYQGPDKQWRFEIPDVNQGEPVRAYGPGSIFLRGGGNPSTIGQTMQHPSLYEAYPDLKNMPILWDQPPKAGYHNPTLPGYGAEHVALSPQDTSGPLTPVVLHELQHAVQWREGFPRGANYYRMQNYARQAAQEMGVPLEGSVVKQAGEQAYLRHAGETESRNVSRRYGSGQLAYDMPPWETEDVPYAQQIVRPPFANNPYANRPQPMTLIDMLRALKGS